MATATLGAAAAAQEPPREGDVLGSASDLRIESGGNAVLLEAGTKLHAEPHRHAAVVTVIDVELALEPLERRESWVRVRFEGRIGWADLAAAARPAADAPAAPSPLPAAPPAAEEIAADETRLARALDLLSEPVQELEAGQFRVYTDVRSQRKRRMLFDVARHLGAAHRARYGLAPERPARFAVIVFAEEASYREFEDSVTDLRLLDAEGHAGSGIAALVAEGRTAAEAAALLVHESAHLLNRQTFRTAPPPWLEEGIANDLAYCRLDKSGRPLPQTLGGKGFIAEIPGPVDQFGRRRFAGTLHVEGPLASLGRLQRALAAGEAVPLPRLLDLTWREFVAPEGRELRYIQSTFLVRYLLDGLDGDSFKRFLNDFQDGADADAAALLSAIGRDWGELATGFADWVRRYTGRE